MSVYGDTTGVCELAALYSLGALDAEAAWRYRAHLLDGCEACRGELDGFERVTDLLALAAPPAVPSPILRSRLMEKLVPDAAWTLPRTRGNDAWEPHELPGILIRKLHVDERSRETVMLVRAEPGARYPGHRHKSVEEIFMLEGELRFGETTYRAGDYIRSAAGSLHGTSETAGGCMFLLRASLDSESLF